MQEFKENNEGNNNEGLTEQQKEEIAAYYRRAKLIRNLIIAAGIFVFVCVIFFVLANTNACSENAIEVVSEPKLVAYPGGEGLKPVVKVEVKNNSNNPIKVRFECVVYGADGKKSTTISSGYELIMPGDVVEIIGTTYDSYPLSQYLDNCIKISELNYSVLKNVK